MSLGPEGIRDGKFGSILSALASLTRIFASSSLIRIVNAFQFGEALEVALGGGIAFLDFVVERLKLGASATNLRLEFGYPSMVRLCTRFRSASRPLPPGVAPPRCQGLACDY